MPELLDRLLPTSSYRRFRVESDVWCYAWATAFPAQIAMALLLLVQLLGCSAQGYEKYISASGLCGLAQ